MGRIWYFLSILCQSVLWNISCLSILHGYSAGVINRTKTFWTQLDNVTKEQNGNYTCLVKNQSGENGSRTIELEMKGETFTPKFCICGTLVFTSSRQASVIVSCAPWSWWPHPAPTPTARLSMSPVMLTLHSQWQPRTLTGSSFTGEFL